MAEIGNVTVRVDAVITDEQYCEVMGAVRAANKRMDLLVAENAKLRELVKMMLLVCKSKGIVGGVFSQPNSNSNLNEQVNFESCACELGIEVD